MGKAKHPEYVFITAYQKRKNLTNEFIAEQLGITVRTYRDKIKGISDFTLTEADKLCELLNETKDTLFS